MKTGKFTVKLKDAILVCLIINSAEVKRYKNIKLPDMLKETEMTDFYFNVHTDRKIAFEIYYEKVRCQRFVPKCAKLEVIGTYNITDIRRKELLIKSLSHK